VGLHGPPRPVLHRANEVHVVKDTLPVPLHVPGWAPHGARAGGRGRGAELRGYTDELCCGGGGGGGASFGRGEESKGLR